MAMESLAATTQTPGELVITSTTAWTQLIARTGATVNGLSCKYVRFSAPSTASPAGAANQQNVLIVASTDSQGNPKQPTTNAGAWPLPPTASGLNYELVADATTLWVKALNSGDAVEYVIGS